MKPNHAKSLRQQPQVDRFLDVLLRESRWFVYGGTLMFLLMSLLSYQHEDPGWSHTASLLQPHNWGGRAGAWIADLLFYLSGLSAYWLVGLCLIQLYHNIRRTPFDPLARILRAFGFVLLLLGSAGLEALRLYAHGIRLPFLPGGVLGAALAQVLLLDFGFAGATLLLILLVLIGLSWFMPWSWLDLCERLGAGVIWCVHSIALTAQAWEDRTLGRRAAEAREEAVVLERKRTEDIEPLRIEIPQVVVKKSKRAQKEAAQAEVEAAQPTLFDVAVLGRPLAESLLPPLRLLAIPAEVTETVSAETLEYTSRLLERKLSEFGVRITVVAVQPGPVITRYEIDPDMGVKGSQIVNLMKDLARALSVASIRVVETIPGKTSMGLEVPNPKRQMVRLSEILSSEQYAAMNSPLGVTLGKDIAGRPVVADLAKMPHLLVAGTTGSGKSVGVNAMILSMLYRSSAEQVRMIMIDPKMLELSIYEGIPHLLAPVVTDMRQAAQALSWCVAEMERRYKLMSALGVRNLAGYNVKVSEAKKLGQLIPHPFSLTPEQPEPLDELPCIVVIIDELADLMMVVGKKIEELIARLAQKARAAGIHLILATQRPSVDVITGLIKANIPTRMSFQVSSKIDSRTILDQMGAEALLGQGDMLYLPPGTGYPLRVHGAFVADEEVHAVVEYLKRVGGPPNYIEGILEGGVLDGDEPDDGLSNDPVESDPLYDRAIQVVLQTRRPSISLVQRHLRIGYNRAARLVEQMEQAGVVSAPGQGGQRTVLAPAEG